MFLGSYSAGCASPAIAGCAPPAALFFTPASRVPKRSATSECASAGSLSGPSGVRLPPLSDRHCTPVAETPNVCVCVQRMQQSPVRIATPPSVRTSDHHDRCMPRATIVQACNHRHRRSGIRLVRSVARQHVGQHYACVGATIKACRHNGLALKHGSPARQRNQATSASVRHSGQWRPINSRAGHPASGGWTVAHSRVAPRTQQPPNPSMANGPVRYNGRTGTRTDVPAGPQRGGGTNDAWAYWRPLAPLSALS